MIQVKQLKRLKYESFDYGHYEKLKKLFLDQEFEPEQLEELDLSNEKAKEMPNMCDHFHSLYILIKKRHCLQLLPNIQVLILAHNNISRFPGLKFAKVMPKLTVLDFSYNHIEELDDLVDMGILDQLRVLDIQGNFVCTYVTRINLIESLLCPKKYIKYNPVGILTAGYNQLPVARLTDEAFKQSQQAQRVIDRLPEELRPDELINTVSKYNHKNTLGKYSLEACPIPRKTRFKRLEYLNGQAITKLEIVRVTGFKSFRQALENIHDKSKSTEKIKKVGHRKKHLEYIGKYMKRINRMLEDDENYNPKPKNNDFDDSTELLNQLADTEKKQVKIDPKIFSQELWEKPLDVKYKDAQFSIGMEDFKKQQKEYEEEKLRKKQAVKDKRKFQRERRYRKKGKVMTYDNDSHDVDSDPEIKRLFRIKSKPIKPQLNLSRNEENSYRSSESSLQENLSSQMSSEEEDEVDNAIPQCRKKQNFVQSEETSALSLRKKLNQPKDERVETKTQKKKVESNAPTKIKPYDETEEVIEKAERKITSMKPAKIESLQRVQSSPINQEQQQKLQQLYPEGPSAIYSYNQNQNGAVLQVQQFRLEKQPISGQKVYSAMAREQNRQSFSVQNKLSSQHVQLSVKELAQNREEQLLKQKNGVIKEREELEEIHKGSEAFKIMENMKKKERPQTTKLDQEEITGGKGKAKERRELVRIHGDINKIEYQKVKIPLNDMITTAEQGIPEHFRQQYLFDNNSEKYKELQHYKKILEESKNLREECKEMDRKIEILGVKSQSESQFKASDFNTVFKFLKQDPNFEIQNSYDPANEIVNNMRKKKLGLQKNAMIPNQKQKVSTYDMREIIYGANEYDAQSEPKIKEKDILNQLSQEKGISMDQRQKLYEWLQILDDLKVKYSKADEKRLKRIEKKEIERAQSFAHLAYHYQKLKKYVPEDKLQKYVKLMGIPVDEIIQENQQTTKIPRQSSNYQRQVQDKGLSKSTVQLKKSKKKPQSEEDETKQWDRVVEEKAQIIEREQVINSKRIQNLKSEILSDQGYMAQNHPNIVQFLREKEKQKNEIMKPQLTFEEMVYKKNKYSLQLLQMDANLRKIQDQFQKKGGGQALTLEDQMMKFFLGGGLQILKFLNRYAQEFNEKVKNRETLQNNIKLYINDISKKVDEFWVWEGQERESRNDKQQCFKRYVRLVREGQIKII